MFRFAEPHYLYLLGLIPAFVALFIYYRRSQRRRLARFADLELIGALIPEASPKRIRTKFVLMMIVVGLLVLALARPQLGAKLREVKSEGVEIVLAVDVSNSMLAEDFAPNRLERTKNAVSQLLERLEKDRVGMVVFAADAFVQLPVTSDYVAAKSFVRSLSPEMVPNQGTQISKAIEMATRSFSSQSERSRAIILITDGESHDDSPLEAAQVAKDSSIVIYTVGIGTPEGAPITINGEMIKDENGEVVVSKLGEELLQQVAALTGGAYIRATDRSIGLSEIVGEIEKLQKQKFTTLAFEEYSDQFHYLLWCALFVFLAEFLVIDRKNRIFAKISIFKGSK